MPSPRLPAHVFHPFESGLFFQACFKQHRPHQWLTGPRIIYTRRPALSRKSRNRFQTGALRPKEEQPLSNTVSSALRNTSAQDNNLLAPVHIPEDPNGVLNEKHPAAQILANSAIVVQRQLELMNILAGFEQANKYIIMDPEGTHIGYIAERDLGMGKTMARQIFRTHRSFETHVFDINQKEVLRFHRPFAWISSRIGVYDPLEVASSSHSSSTALARRAPGSESNDTSPQVSQLALSEMRVIGQAQQQWVPLRRKYNLSLYRQPPSQKTLLNSPNASSSNYSLSKNQQLQPSSASEGEDIQFSQFAYIDEPFLSWDFSLVSADSRRIGSVNRNFAGFGREIFTDTGVYALRMDAAGSATDFQNSVSETGVARQSSLSGMTFDQRAVMLATAVSVDFDYFSRKSGFGGMMWLPWFGGGGDAGAGASAEGAAEAAGEEGRGPVSSNDVAAAAGVAGATLAPMPTVAHGDDRSTFESSGNEADGVESGTSGGGGDGDGGDGGWLDNFF